MFCSDLEKLILNLIKYLNVFCHDEKLALLKTKGGCNDFINFLLKMTSWACLFGSGWNSFFLLQNELHNEQKSKIKYIQQCPNWHFVTKKGNVKTRVNKITKQNNLLKSVTEDEKHY